MLPCATYSRTFRSRRSTGLERWQERRSFESSTAPELSTYIGVGCASSRPISASKPRRYITSAAVLEAAAISASVDDKEMQC
eukprot:726698-Pleurochrysis_carterae.AAC.1